MLQSRGAGPHFGASLEGFPSRSLRDCHATYNLVLRSMCLKSRHLQKHKFFRLIKRDAVDFGNFVSLQIAGKENKKEKN